MNNNSSNIQPISQARICVQKFGEQDTKVIAGLRDISQSQQHFNNLQAAFLIKNLWKPNTEIKIGFLGDGKNTPKTPVGRLGKNADPLTQTVYDLPPIEGVKKIVNERYAPITNLKFKFVDDPKDADVRIDFDPNGGAWSFLGTDCLNYKYPQATMNFGWIDAPTIMHEFGHCMGMFHEHQNPRGQGINWDREAVYKWASETQGWDKQTTDTNILDHYNKNGTNGSIYDPLSIMLYFFPSWLTTDDKGTKQNSKFSGTDVLWINNMYKKGSPQTAEEFYPKVYGVPLKESLEQSKQAGASIEILENFEMCSNDKCCMTSFLWIFIIFVIIMIFYLQFYS